ncbi:MAG TPA: dephospho-CoA kinase [Candidatus Acidoferrum sp.]|nr:dephospho-CoA kinase [Candidatus Acidoferrum sp.]
MRRLGLTGGIASGKSWVGNQLRELGFHILDADLISHELITPGLPAYENVILEFGKEILREDKSIDRKRLGAIVFADPKKLAKLNSILHPRIEEAMNQQFRVWRAQGVTDPVFVEAALLVEAGMHKRLDGLVVVYCKLQNQIERLVARGLSEAEARRRIALQLPTEEKLKFATYKIDTSYSMEYTQEQIAALAEKLRARPA